MKKVISIILVLIAVFGLWFIFVKTSDTSNSQKINKVIGHPDASNATFIFDDGPITLKKGSNSQSVIPGGELTQDTILTDTVGFGDINGDKKEDSVSAIAQSGGGSGVFIYLGAYVSGPLDYKGSNAVFVGDRIEPKSISISSDGVIIFKYLDRKPNEPYAAEPTVLTTKYFLYSKDSLVER